MQDRFKFRSYGKPNSIIEGMQNIYTFEETEGGYFNVKVDKGWLSFVKEEDLKIMQCTGLKDKNGKLIYEGDILKYTSKPTNTQKNNPEYKPFAENYSVVWGDFYTGYNLRSKEKVNCFNLGIMTKDCEVIGNIYENPELLEQL